MAYNVRIELLRAQISKRQSRRDVFKKTRYEGMICFDYQGFSNELYQNVRFESHIELKITYQVLKFLPSLEPTRSILYVEAVIDMLENFCQFNIIDKLIDKIRIQFVCFTNILPSETMLCYFNSTNVEHRSYNNLKKFLGSEYTQSCENFKRSEPQAQKENVISEEYPKSLDDEIRKLEEKLSRRKLRISREKAEIAA